MHLNLLRLELSKNICPSGNEATLLMFDILVFCTIDFYANDFVTATILTFLLSWVSVIEEANALAIE